jgi:WD40 repeat protein/tRNA A-37 threonylcarbamoyl transferase component Bud32
MSSGNDPAVPTVAGGSLIEGPGTQIGRYKLLEKLGEGGFGAVYVAEQREPVKRRLALKLVKLGMDTRQVVARFEAERQALALMDHPHIAKVLDAGATDTGRPYFVMELVRGVPITRYCDENNLAPAERLDLFIHVCQAIQHAHQKGIIHRDIKPSNILVSMHDGVPVPKVIDFGIAKATQGELTDATIYTHFQQFVGTPAYMSPEQVEMSGLDIDTRSDIYSLGVLLYELLVGTTPFDAGELLKAGLDDMRRTIRDKEPLRPSNRLSCMAAPDQTTTAKRRGAEAGRLIHLLRGDLDWIVMKCIEKDRTRRYETANGLAADLKRHLNNEPVTARPPSAAYRLQKAWRRNKVLYAAGLTVALALVAGVVGTSLGLIRAKTESVRAEAAARLATKAREEAQRARALAEGRAAELAVKAAELETNLYFNRIALAHREITSEPPNMRLGDKLLRDCPEQLRDWEWHYLTRRRFAEPLVLTNGGNAIIHSVGFSSNGRLLASGGGDHRIQIWDLVSSARPIQTLTNHTGFVVAVVFSPTNPAWLASAGADQRLRLWNWSEGRELRSWPAETTLDYGLSYAIAFSPDSLRLAAPGANGELIIWDTSSGRKLLSLPGHHGPARSVSFSPDRQWIATGGSQGDVHLWNAANGQPAHNFGGNKPPIAAITFAPDSRHLVVLDFNGAVTRWDIAARRQLSSYSVRAGGGRSICLALHPTADRLLTGGMDRLVTLSQPSTGRQVLVFRDLASECYSLTLSPDGTRLAAAGRAGTVRVWDAAPLTGRDDPSLRTLSYPGHELRAFDISPNGRAVAAGGNSPEGGGRAPLLVWNSPAFDSARELFGHAIVVFSMAYDPSGRFLASSGDEELRQGRARIKVWDVESGSEATEIEAFEGDGRYFSVAYSPDGRWLAGAGNDKKLKIWHASTGRKAAVVGSHAREISKVAFSADGRYLASVGNDDVVKVWDGTNLDKPQSNPRVLQGLGGVFTDLIAFTPDNRHLAVVTDDETVTILDLDAQEKDLRFSCRGHRPVALAISPDGRWLASGGGDCTVRLWDAHTTSLRHTFRSHLDQVTRLKFFQTPDGTRLVSCSHDGSLKFWDIAPFESP